MKSEVKARILLFLGLILPAGQVFSQDFATEAYKFDSNQKKILTLVATGTMNVDIYSLTSSTPLRSFNAGITIYLKSPNLFKLIVNSQNGSSTMVQKGDEISQLIPGTKTVVTSKVTNTNNLFQKYLVTGISDNASKVHILATNQINDANKGPLQEFVAEVAAASSGSAQANSQLPAIDKVEYFFDANGMLVRVISLSNDVVVIETDYDYKKSGEVFATSKIQTTVISRQQKIVSTMSYSAVDANSVVADKEFILR